MRSTPPTSAIPFSYYTVFAIYEPALTTLGFVGALLSVFRSAEIEFN
jgi:hypothetical protein